MANVARIIFDCKHIGKFSRSAPKLYRMRDRRAALPHRGQTNLMDAKNESGCSRRN